MGVRHGGAYWIEIFRRQAIRIQLNCAHGFQPAVLDGVYAITTARAQYSLAVGAGRRLGRPCHGAWAVAREPVSRAAGRVHRPDIWLLELGCRRHVRFEPADVRVLGEVEDLTRLRAHAASLPRLGNVSVVVNLVNLESVAKS